jgi:hypothetical protein
VTCRMLPHSFIHDTQRGLGIISCADHVGAICQEQLDFEFAQGAILHMSGGGIVRYATPTNQ